MTQTDTDQLTAKETLDCTGLLCPLPVYHAGGALSRLQSGEVLKLLATDPGAREDVPALARQRGDKLLATEMDGETIVFWLERGEGQ